MTAGACTHSRSGRVIFHPTSSKQRLQQLAAAPFRRHFALFSGMAPLSPLVMHSKAAFLRQLVEALSLLLLLHRT